jgi:hypothetical protein
MLRRLCRCAFVLVVIRTCVATPAFAQVLEPNVQPFAFPVLASATYDVTPHGEVGQKLFHVSSDALMLRSTAEGWLDLTAYCQLPDRHWGPVSIVSSSLEVSGQQPRYGLGLPSRIALSDLPLGSTVKLRMLMQAPLIVLDLEGNASAVLDTFVEEYTWRITAVIRP